MIRLRQIEMIEIRMPLVEPFQISSGTQSDRRIFLLKVTDHDRHEVWAECVATELPTYTYETIDAAWIAIREWVAPRVLGSEFKDPREVHPVLEKNFHGNNMAKAGIEMACWGLAATIKGVALAKLINGTRAKIPTGISIGIQASPDALAEKAKKVAKEGYRKLKLKIKPGMDVEFVKAVRTALPDAPLMADANNAYTLDDAATLAKLDQFGLIMLEQPLDWQDFVRHAELQKRLKTPICLDESISNVDRAQDMITLKAGKIINIKPGRVGGFRQAIAIHDLCQQNGIPVWCGGMLESGIGRAYNVALASLPNFSLPGDVSPSARYWEKDIVAPQWTMDQGGMVTVPTAAGIGVRVDADRIDNLAVRRETVK